MLKENIMNFIPPLSILTSLARLKASFNEWCINASHLNVSAPFFKKCSIRRMFLSFVSLIEDMAIPSIFYHLQIFLKLFPLPIGVECIFRINETSMNLSKLAKTSIYFNKIISFQIINHKFFACNCRMNILWKGLNRNILKRRKRWLTKNIMEVVSCKVGIYSTNLFWSSTIFFITFVFLFWIRMLEVSPF